MLSLATNAELEQKKEVWIAFSDLFLDTDVSLFYSNIVNICASSSYSLEELKQILYWEVGPVCVFNLYNIAGEWAGFDPEWLVHSISQVPPFANKVYGALHQPFLSSYLQEHWAQIALQIEEKRKKP